MNVKTGDTVQIRDLFTHDISTSRVLAANRQIIVTMDEEDFVDRFDPDGWNFSRTREIIEPPNEVVS